MSVIKYGYTGRETTVDHIVKSVGPGWEQLIRKLVEDLFINGWDGSLLQVKEKFGGLRFYIGKGNDILWSIISTAETASLSICEICGEPGKLRDGGWIKTLCDTHAKEQS